MPDHVMELSPSAQAEHLAHLREMLATRSIHGPVIPQPDSVGEAATKSFTITAQSFSFTISPTPFTVNQGDVVNITLTVPSKDGSTVGHGILMESYIENGLNCARGGTETFQFTATTAGTFAFVCNIPDCGTGHSSMFGTMKVNAVQNPAPTIASILPTSGSIAGGTVVTIAGTGFLTNATVKFGGVAATNVSVTSTSITATAPAHAAGKVDVVVTNSDGQSATLPQSFTYVLPAPTVASVSPNTGPTSGGTPVTITGTNFQSGATVTFGALPATDVTVVSATSITARTPLGPVSSTLAVDVSVTNPDSLKGTATGAFTYTVPALAVISITPNTALPAGAAGAAATAVTIYGAGFSSASTSVTVVGVAATNVQVIDPVTIHATFAVHAAGTDDVVVTVGATSATLHNGFSWQNAPPKHRSVKH
ncbi:MAG: IPT/TIG domain-containing protein [Acidobacteria bacterium]|nr:IPT/TIG domain-containing protein [Acidobacteriota bacterium]MBV9188715.1 IPT/TIG domain-containing protein [Acidobacteriota bacterium]